MADQIIPLDTSPNQTFAVSLSVDGKTLRLQLSIGFNEMASYWVMAIADQNGNLLLSSIPLISGVWPAGNLLQQYGYLKIGSAYIINASGVASDYPDRTNLGSDFVMIWSDTAA